VKPRQFNFIRTATAFIFFLGIFSAARLWYIEEQGNFHPVTHREAYRSAQLDRDELKFYIRNFAIRSIINLKGKAVDGPMYDEEIATCRDMGVRHYDLGLSAGKKPSSHEIEKLLKLFRIAPRPVLIHCRAGADRSGLAAALWKVVIDGAPKSVARDQLSIRYGHMPFRPTQVLDQFFAEWIPQEESK